MKPKVTKKYRELFIQSSAQKVLEVLFKHPEKEFSLSDLAKESKVAKPHIGKILKEFENKNLITIVKLTKIWRIKANQQDLNFLRSKISYNLNFIHLSGLIEFLNSYFGNPKSIILFGSFRNGEDISTSDIDIAIESHVDQIISLKELSDFEKEINRKIQLHLFNRKNIDVNLFNNIVNGIKLSGFLEVKP